MNVPHITQSEETTCGAAALAMVYQYFQIPGQDEAAIWNRLKIERPGAPGEYYLETPDIARDSLQFGYSYFLAQAVLTSSETALQPVKEFLNRSIPVIVCQRVTETNEWGHFRIVTAINDDMVSLNDPMHDASETMTIERFMQLWQKSTATDEVIGGQFLAIFKKEHIDASCQLHVYGFNAPVSSFAVSSLRFE